MRSTRRCNCLRLKWRSREVLFIQTFCARIAAGSGDCKRGWLRAILDPQIGAESVNRPWTVESLAAAAGIGIRSALQRTARTDTPRLCNQVEDAEGVTFYYKRGRRNSSKSHNMSATSRTPLSARHLRELWVLHLVNTGRMV